MAKKPFPDAPEWFDRENYRVVRNFSPEQWAIELVRRFMEWETAPLLERSVIERPIILGPPLSDMSVFFTPFLEPFEIEENVDELMGDFYDAQIPVVRNKPAREFTFYDTHFLASQFKKKFPHQWADFNDMIERETWDVPIWRFMNKPVNEFFDWDRFMRTCEASINISLWADDDQILKEVKRLLPILRAKKSEPYHLSESVPTILNKLYDYRIFQQLDLRLYERLSGEKITYKHILEWVFPDRPSVGVEDLRKTHQRYVRDSITSPFIYRILFYAEDLKQKEKAEEVK